MSNRRRRRSLMRLEHRTQPLLPRRGFLIRMAWTLLATLVLVALSLFIGALGYHGFEGLPWLDSVLNAAMILSGMGPVNQLQSQNGKLFATFYALFSGLAFVSVTALLLGPIAHRCLHRFHVEWNEEEEEARRHGASDGSAADNPGRRNHH